MWFKSQGAGTSLVVQWQRICLSMRGNAGSIPGQGTKIPHTAGQLSPCATTTELAHLNERAHMPQTTEPTRPGACKPHLEGSPRALTKSPHTSMKILCATTKTQRSQRKKRVKELLSQEKGRKGAQYTFHLLIDVQTQVFSPE